MAIEYIYNMECKDCKILYHISYSVDATFDIPKDKCIDCDKALDHLSTTKNTIIDCRITKNELITTEAV